MFIVKFDIKNNEIIIYIDLIHLQISLKKFHFKITEMEFFNI